MELIKQRTESIAKRKAIDFAIAYFRKNIQENDVGIQIEFKNVYEEPQHEIVFVRREGLSAIFRMDIVKAKRTLDNSELRTLSKDEILKSWEYLKTIQLKRLRKKKRKWLKVGKS